MGFMQKQVCHMACWQVETTCGTERVPADLCGADSLSDYLEGKQRDEPELVKGWFARLSAPGYMDCTEWCGPFETEQEASEHLDEMYGDEETA